MSLKHTILVLLESESGTGYDIAKKFQGSLGNFWSASHQQIYHELGKLDKDGLVTWKQVPQEGKPDKKVYEITASGIEELRNWMHSPIPSQKVRDHLMVRMVATHLVDPMVLHEQLGEIMARCDKKLTTLKQFEATFFDMIGGKTLQSEMIYLSLKRGIELQESWLRWAEEVQATLEKYRDA
ncbi:MAG: PadR family transcriptional regulator [Pseudomonadales bacterium]|nr:PadR family transcriptional regulator [Pseudomonadales bacterium]